MSFLASDCLCADRLDCADWSDNVSLFWPAVTKSALTWDVLSKDDLKGTRIEHGFKRAFMSLFGQDADTFTCTMLLNVDQLQKQLDKDEFQEDGSMAAFWVVNNQFQKFINSQFTLDYDSQMTDKYFVEYTGIEVKHFRDTLLQHMGNVKKFVAERTRHQRQHDRKVKRKTDVDAKSEVQDESNRSGNNTDVDDTYIRPIYDEEPKAEYPEQCQVKGPMLDSLPDNQTTDYSKQSLESENILLKKTIAQFQKDFLRMEAHCIALELKYQNHALKSGQHGQILNETSNKAKIKRDIDEIETINIELEHSVAKLLIQNEHLNKENKTLKKHYKDISVFAIAALKNDLRKLKGNSVDTKFAKTSVLGKPVLQSLRNQSVVRQPNAFKSERPQMSKQRFASQVDVNNNSSRPVTQHYLPKRRESAFAKPDHMIASSESRISSKNMPRFSSNDMVHNHYLDEARKKTQERDRNSKTSVMPSARFQSTADGSKPKPRSNNQTPRSLPIFTGHRSYPNKTSAVYEKTSPRSDLRWKPMGKIFKYVGLRWIPTGKLFDSCTSKVDSEPPHGSNADIPNIHKCKQTLDISAGKPQSVVAEKADISKTNVTVDSQMMKLQ
ncbi:hypothetical protein Tco_1369789 [Tanacetum coccineum]